MVRKPPPAPRNADRVPMTPPVAARPAVDGRARGCPSRVTATPGRSILKADQPMKAAKKAAISRPGSAPTTCAPSSVPTTIPGARAFTISQRTAPRR